VVDQQFLGTERFVDAWQGRMKDVPSLRPRQSLPRALQAVATGMGRDVGLFQSADRSWAVSQQRTMAAYLLIRRWGYRASDVVAAFNRDPATLSSGLTRFVVRLREEPALQRALARLATIIKVEKPDPSPGTHETPKGLCAGRGIGPNGPGRHASGSVYS
jgi:hypothetical protein